MTVFKLYKKCDLIWRPLYRKKKSFLLWPHSLCIHKSLHTHTHTKKVYLHHKLSLSADCTAAEQHQSLTRQLPFTLSDISTPNDRTCAPTRLSNIGELISVNFWSTGLVTASTRRFCLLHCARFGPGTPASRTAGALRGNYGNIYTGRPVKQHVTRGCTLRCDVMSGGRGQQLVRGGLLIGIRPKYPGASDQRRHAGAFSRRHSTFTSLASCHSVDTFTSRTSRWFSSDGTWAGLVATETTTALYIFPVKREGL